jgi:peptidoglycan/xylan/chitin deacetylase (PgdA/CDA1 family)
MTIKTQVFEGHLRYLRDNGYKVIPLRQLIAWKQKKGPPPPAKSVVIVEDDAHKSVYTDMLPLVKRYKAPVTVFIYPSAISNAKYAMTWEQLRELKKTGLFDFQSHTYWHPNFKRDRKKMRPEEFEKSVNLQLAKSKARIEKELGVKVDMLAWPFGIYDDYLLKKAAAAGYVATFSIERRHVTGSDNVIKLSRYLMINSDQGNSFTRILAGTAPKRDVVY